MYRHNRSSRSRWWAWQETEQFKGEAVPIGGERFGRGVGPGEGRVLQGEGSAAGPLSDRDPVADRGGVQLVERV